MTWSTIPCSFQPQMRSCSNLGESAVPSSRTSSRIAPSRLIIFPSLLLAGCLTVPGFAERSAEPESVLRTLVRANAEKNLEATARFMAHDVDAIGYTIGGRKYVGWEQFAADMRDEFNSVSQLEIPITDLRLWTRGEVAWFADGKWVLVTWHESPRGPGLVLPITGEQPEHFVLKSSQSDASPEFPDLSGEWQILEVEDNKSYKATLDRTGNGPYTWQEGRITTTNFKDRFWQGAWRQTGNDREGGFEVVLSEDSTQAKGIWWYTRVGPRNNIPPRQHGGTYVWRRLTPPPTQTR